MKKVLSLLLAYIFLQTQIWAIGGGPEGSAGGGFSIANLPGTYSGTLIPTDTDSDSGTITGDDDVDATSSAASIGLFSVGVPQSGIATGVAVVFVDGVAFTGQMLAVADPANGTLNGVIDATSNFDIVTFVPSAVDADGNVTFTESRTKIFAQGNIQTNIIGGGLGNSNNTLTAGGSGSTRLTGTANVDIFSELNNDGSPDVTETVNFTVDGFKQSDTSSTVTFDFALNTTGGETS